MTFDDLKLSVKGLNHEDLTEEFSYTIDFDHFKLTQYSNNILTMVVNPVDSLYFENGN